MKFLLLLTIFFISISVYSQDDEILNIAFKDKSNFDITKSLNHKKPEQYFVLSTTDNWNMFRFHLNENVKSDSIRKILAAEEHHPYNNSYIFKDADLDKLFNDQEKENLYQLTLVTKPIPVSNGNNDFRLIKSFKAAANGFFFSVTEPLYSSDRKFVFIDITTYRKDAETKELNDSSFGTTLLIYQNIEGKGWKRIKKIDNLIL